LKCYLVETSYYEQPNTLNDEIKQEEEEENYFLEFNSNKKIDQTADLDAIIIYLENRAAGQDIQTFQIEPESNGSWRQIAVQISLINLVKHI